MAVDHSPRERHPVPTELSTASAVGQEPRAWWLLLLPIAFLLHLAEEWLGGMGLPAWTTLELGSSLSPTRFLLINAVAWPLFALLTWLGIVRPGLAWFPSALATLMVLNALLHALGTLAFSAYSPGLITGVGIYLPLGVAAWLHGRRVLRRAAFQSAVVIGVLIHAAVAVVAFA